MADISGMAASVERARTVNASAVALINGFKSQLDSAIAAAVAANDDADLSALTDLSSALGSSVDELASAVEANTPGAPPV
jgi:hypothetical protein